jgi:Zn-dependent protease
VFGEPPSTRYDLNFRLFGTRVRVHPFFWLASALLSFSFSKYSSIGFAMLPIAVACVFLSILVHEFGHVLVGRYFGSHGHIVLYGFGGLAIGSSNLSNRWQRVAVSLAGPGAQFVLLAVLLGGAFALTAGSYVLLGADLAGQPPLLEGDTKPGEAQPPPDEQKKLGESDGKESSGRQKPLNESKDRGFPAMVLLEILGILVWINLVWPILNLVPIWPLDGGKVCRELCEWRMPGSRGIRVSLYISIGASIAGAMFMLYLWQLFMTIFFGIFGYMAYRELQMLGGGGGGWGQPPPRKPWEADPDWWKTGRKDPWS